MTLKQKILSVFELVRGLIGKRAARTELAAEFSAYEKYDVGRLVVYEDELYRCVKETRGVWNSKCFTKATVDDAVQTNFNSIVKGSLTVNAVVAKTSVRVDDGSTGGAVELSNAKIEVSDSSGSSASFASDLVRVKDSARCSTAISSSGAQVANEKNDAASVKADEVKVANEKNDAASVKADEVKVAAGEANLTHSSSMTSSEIMVAGAKGSADDGVTPDTAVLSSTGLSVEKGADQSKRSLSATSSEIKVIGDKTSAPDGVNPDIATVTASELRFERGTGDDAKSSEISSSSMKMTGDKASTQDGITPDAVTVTASELKFESGTDDEAVSTTVSSSGVNVIGDKTSAPDGVNPDIATVTASELRLSHGSDCAGDMSYSSIDANGIRVNRARGASLETVRELGIRSDAIKFFPGKSSGYEDDSTCPGLYLDLDSGIERNAIKANGDFIPVRGIQAREGMTVDVYPTGGYSSCSDFYGSYGQRLFSVYKDNYDESNPYHASSRGGLELFADDSVNQYSAGMSFRLYDHSELNVYPPVFAIFNGDINPIPPNSLTALSIRDTDDDGVALYIGGHKRASRYAYSYISSRSCGISTYELPAEYICWASSTAAFTGGSDCCSDNAAVSDWWATQGRSCSSCPPGHVLTVYDGTIGSLDERWGCAGVVISGSVMLDADDGEVFDLSRLANFGGTDSSSDCGVINVFRYDCSDETLESRKYLSGWAVKISTGRSDSPYSGQRLETSYLSTTAAFGFDCALAPISVFRKQANGDWWNQDLVHVTKLRSTANARSYCADILSGDTLACFGYPDDSAALNVYVGSWEDDGGAVFVDVWQPFSEEGTYGFLGGLSCRCKIQDTSYYPYHSIGDVVTSRFTYAYRLSDDGSITKEHDGDVDSLTFNIATSCGVPLWLVGHGNVTLAVEDEAEGRTFVSFGKKELLALKELLAGMAS